jgi:hypothetical protein
MTMTVVILSQNVCDQASNPGLPSSMCMKWSSISSWYSSGKESAWVWVGCEDQGTLDLGYR